MVSAGPAQGDEATAVLAVWGNLIAVVNPELGPEGRRAILERLGVDLDRPLTLGLDTETTESGARYWLRSGILNGRVHFGVEPNRTEPPSSSVVRGAWWVVRSNHGFEN